MQFSLKGKITFSGNLRDALEDIAVFIKNANDNLLKKGAPEGKSAKVSDWSIEDNVLFLSINSERYVRSHDALLRLKKGLSEFLGKTYKVGARSIFIDEYKITFELEKEKLAEIKIPFAEKIEIEGKNCTMFLKNIDEEFLQNNYIDRMITLVKEKVNAQYYEGKKELHEVIWQSPQKKEVWNKDPTEEMLKLNWLKQGPTKGKWFFFPQIAKILRTMEKIAIEEVLLPLKFQEVIESHLDAFEILLKTGHLEGMPMELYYVCEPKTRDVKEWEYFRDYVKITKTVPKDELAKLISPPNASICYAQCPVIYWSLTNCTIASESLPILIYDRSANSNRYESGGRHGIERVDEFHRIEPVYIGTKEQLIEVKNKLIEKYKFVFNEILDLEWRMANVRPFYLQQSGKYEDEDDKIKGTIDFEAYLPYRGREGEWLEFQNLSIVGDKYTKVFNIKGQREELWSGCSGIGLERWTSAFLSQKGLNEKNWTKEFRERFGEMNKGVKML